ncbi:MAG: hypothetical protein IPM21_12040 [Acidobacteria bacterium]|nr:hypothetical protein [Acidobacteriota bacterium]
MNIDQFRIPAGKKVDLSKFKTDDTDGYKDKDQAREDLAKNIERMTELQDMLYAQDVYSLLIVFQAMDAAGKDGAIKHVMSVNPQGVSVVSFKAFCRSFATMISFGGIRRHCPGAARSASSTSRSH